MENKEFMYTGKYPWEEISFCVDDSLTDDKVVQYWTYDANLSPLPDMSQWNEEYCQYIADFVKEKLKDETRKVLVDDVVIKE